MNQELEKKNFLKMFSLIITCRENYVDRLKLKEVEYITLQAWDEGQIRSFCKTYEKVIIRRNSELRVNKNLELRVNKIIEKKDIMGVPLILYMVLALDIDIERSSSIVGIYDQIFSLEVGGIYDRSYDAEHRINAPEIKKHIHHISQRIAFWMFENNADEAIISREKFEEICENEMKESTSKNEGIKSDTLIGNFFQIKHCEGKGTSEIQFVHRSIYEYFVTIYFFESVCKLQSKEEFAGKLGELLKDGYLSEEILEFVKYKFDGMKGYDLSDIIKKVFNIMLQDGMAYYVTGRYKNIIERELNVFSNMLEVVHLWNSDLKEIDDRIVFYLKFNHQTGLNLEGINLEFMHLRGVFLDRVNLNHAYLKNIHLDEAKLEGASLERAHLEGGWLCETNLCQAHLERAHLERAHLEGAHLEGTHLERAHLERAHLEGAHLEGTHLEGAHLEGAHLEGAHLEGAHLEGAHLEGANLKGAYIEKIDLKGANLRNTIFDERQIRWLGRRYFLNDSMVLLSTTGNIIKYAEYCMRKQK